MTLEERAEEWLFSHSYDIINAMNGGKIKEAYLAGAKENGIVWHDLRKDPNDLPKDKHNVWCKCLDECGEGWYDKDTNIWTLIYRGYHVHCIEAWCELPTFDKE